MKKQMALLSLTLLIFSLMAFQNCGGKMATSAGSSGNNTNVIPPGSGNTNWNAGDNFIYSSLPSTYKSQMVETLLNTTGYATFSGPKAVAITSTGLGYVRLGPAGSAQSEVNQLSLQSCFAVSGGQNCALLASANVFAVSRNNLPNSFTFSMTPPSSPVAGTNIPFYLPTTATNIASAYNSASSPKALAIAIDGSAYYLVSQSTSTPVGSAAEAMRVALERCELTATASPCTLFAVDGNILFNPSFVNRTPKIDYLRTALGSDIPGMREAAYTTNIKDKYLANVNGTSVFGSIYMAANGALGFAYDPSATLAETTARNICTQNNPTGLPCFKYATNKTINNDVLLTSLESRRVYGPDHHCKVVPRASCTIHRQMGCITGQFYTTANGTVALESCL